MRKEDLLLQPGKNKLFDSDASIRRLVCIAIYLLGAMVLISLIFLEVSFAASVFLGGLLAILNFQWMKAGIDRILGTGDPAPAGRVLVRFVLRLVLILATLFAMIQLSFFSLYGAVLGLSIFVLAGTVEAGILLTRNLR